MNYIQFSNRDLIRQLIEIRAHLTILAATAGLDGDKVREDNLEVAALNLKMVEQLIKDFRPEPNNN